MNHNIGIVLATMALVVASMVAAAPGGKHGPGGHDHGPRNDHGPRGHDHRSGHDHGPRGHDHGHDRDQPTEANEVAPLEPGRCTKIVSATVTATQSYQTRRRVATRTRCGWLHLAHCRKYRWNPHVAYRQVTKLVYVNVRKCCVGFMEVNGVCEPQGGRTLPPPTTIITAPPASTTPRDDSIPDDEMMMIDNSLQKFVFFVIVLVTILIIGIVIGAVVVHLCGGRKEVMRRISTRRFHRKTRKETTKDLNGKTCGKTPEDDPPPRYQSFNKHDKQTPSTKGAGVAYHPHGHDHSNDHAHGHSYGHKHGHTHDQTHGHTHNHSHKGYKPTAPPNDEEYANADMMDARPKVALPVPGNGVKAKSCDAQAGYVEIYESEPIPAKHGHH